MNGYGQNTLWEALYFLSLQNTQSGINTQLTLCVIHVYIMLVQTLAWTLLVCQNCYQDTVVQSFVSLSKWPILQIFIIDIQFWLKTLQFNNINDMVFLFNRNIKKYYPLHKIKISLTKCFKASKALNNLIQINNTF